MGLTFARKPFLFFAVEKTPPSMEEIISLSKNIDTVKLYEKLASKYNWKSFSEYINEASKDFSKPLK